MLDKINPMQIAPINIIKKTFNEFLVTDAINSLPSNIAMIPSQDNKIETL
jgi:hypothetical protein